MNTDSLYVYTRIDHPILKCGDVIQIHSSHFNYYIRRVSDNLDIPSDHTVSDLIEFNYQAMFDRISSIDSYINIFNDSLTTLKVYKDSKLDDMPNNSYIVIKPRGDFKLGDIISHDKEQSLQFNNEYVDYGSTFLRLNCVYLDIDSINSKIEILEFQLNKLNILYKALYKLLEKLEEGGFKIYD